MANSSGEPPIRARVGVWLRNVLTAVLILFLCLLSFLIYRMAVVMGRVEQTVAAVSGDLQTVTSTVSTLSTDISNIRDDMTRLKDKARDAIPYDEARDLIEEAIAIGAASDAEEIELPPEVETEIKLLLARVVGSGCESQCGEHRQSSATLYARLYGRLKLKRGSIRSAEEFIDVVATQSMTGDTYYLVDADGTQHPLCDWMREQLAEIRADKTPTTEGEAQ